MRLGTEIRQRFKEHALEHLGKDAKKHSHYLQKVAFSANSGLISQQDFEDAITLFSMNPQESVEKLLQAVLPAMEKTMATVHGRARTMLNKHHTAGLSVVNTGSGYMVQSERGNKMYRVSLTDLECTCPYYEKIKASGMVCKHIYLAWELSAETEQEPVQVETELPEKPERKEVLVTGHCFTYGSQTLQKRERRGNPHIPTGITYILEGTQPEVAIYALSNNETLLLVGESGVGKSKLVYYLAQETNTPLLNACGHNEITVESLLGTMTVINGSTVWRDGILPLAMRRGYWLMLDEINSIDPGVTKVINEMLDTRKITITVAGEPRQVRAHRDFRLICTMNPPDSPIYKGIETMSFELMDRFDTVVHLDYLSGETEIELIMQLAGYTDRPTAKKIVEFAQTIRKAMRQGEVFATVTTRSLISFCRKAQSFDIRTAADVTILRKMPDADREKATDMFNAIFR